MLEKEEITMKQSRYSGHLPKYIGLIVFCLLTTIFIFLPVLAEDQTTSKIYISISEKTSSNKSLINEAGQKSSSSASASSLTANYSKYVGKIVQMWVAGTNPIPGETVLFQRSEDGINWCTYHTDVTGSDGYAYYNYTESCPGIVYYRGADVNGQNSGNTISIEWLQTDPPTTCVPIPKCVQKTYSITCIENYDNVCGGPGKTNCSIPGSLQECDNFATALNNAGYKQNFYNKDGDVIAENFGTDPSYSGNTLTESAFHYHSGHGADAGKIGFGLTGTYLLLKPWAIWSPLSYTVSAGDVENKWGGENKWVMLDSCNIFRDNDWGQSLTTSHGILGFTSDSGVNLTFPDTFMKYALNKDETIVGAYKQATLDTYHDDNVTAKVLVKTSNQLYNDQFPGHGYMAPDGDPNSFDIKHLEWKCRSGYEW
ncbi:MAG: DUF6345 domain-containing protein [Methanoregula sp.]|uniref:DUF6345 domain-containing protein n=1 Tax=Methanoregula sp. TaxID=2052170 RepID=UPI003C261125